MNRIGQQLKIFYTVIGLNSIYMMNNFAFIENPSQMILHHGAMFIYVMSFSDCIWMVRD